MVGIQPDDQPEDRQAQPEGQSQHCRADPQVERLETLEVGALPFVDEGGELGRGAHMVRVAEQAGPLRVHKRRHHAGQDGNAHGL